MLQVVRRYTTKGGEEKVYIYTYPNKKYYRHLNIKRCLERDNYTCQLCGATHNLHVHHKDNNSARIKGNKIDNDLSNLVTLCASCHLKLHHGVLGRTEGIIALWKEGKTLQQIANHYRVSRQRIHQIIKTVAQTIDKDIMVCYSKDMAKHDSLRKLERNRLLREYAFNHPEMSGTEIGRIFAISRQRVSIILKHVNN